MMTAAMIAVLFPEELDEPLVILDSLSAQEGETLPLTRGTESGITPAGATAGLARTFAP